MRPLAPAILTCALVLAACGGGTPRTASTVGGSSGGGTVSGTVSKGAVSGAVVSAYAIANGTMGAQVGAGTTDANGDFTVPVGSQSGPMMLQASGGTYTDEATGARMTLQPGDVLAAAIPSVAAGATTGGIQVTPLTTMAHDRAHHMSGGITAENITAANAAIGALYGVGDILHTRPMNPAVAGSATGASQDSRNYGMTLAAISQYAKTMGMTSSSGMVTALASDASDGTMDGKLGTSAILLGGGMPAGTALQADAGTAGLAGAMATFVGSSMNRSGVSLADMQSTMAQLSGSGGQMPGAGGGMTNGTMAGTATKGPVAGGTVTAYAVVGGMTGAQLGSAPTGASGDFSVPMGGYAGPVMLRMTGGTYADEATGATMPMMAADAMLACVPSIAAGSAASGVQITPLTSMACARAKAMPGGMVDANVGAANAAVGAYFSVTDLLHAMPMDPTVAGAGAGATPDARNHGMAIAAMSRYAQDVGMTASSSGIVTAMMADASDGVMDGRMGPSSVSMAGMGGMTGGSLAATAGTSALATAMGEFVGSAMNRSGVTASDMQALMTQLSGSNGQLPSVAGASAPGMMSGTGFMGALGSGTVTAYAVSGGTMGPPLASGPLDASGRFALALGAYSGPVMLQVSGGSFADEATATQMPMEPGDVMTACVPSFAAGASVSGLQVTPLTSMAQARAQGMAGGMTAANVSAANVAVGNYFGVGDILMTAPMDPARAGSASGATRDSKDYGMAIAAMSQYAKGVGMTVSSSGMVTAMTKDATDGVLNGMMGSTAITLTGMGGMSGGGMMGGSGGMMASSAGTSGLASAMTAFVGSAQNRSGASMADVQALVDALAASSGAIR